MNNLNKNFYYRQNLNFVSDPSERYTHVKEVAKVSRTSFAKFTIMTPLNFPFFFLATTH